MSGQLAHGRNVSRLLGIGEESEVLGDLPYEDLAVVRTGSDDAVVKGVPVNHNNAVSPRIGRGACPEYWYSCLPVGIQDNGSVSAEQGHLVGQLALLVDGDDGECATAARLPIDRQVLRVRFYLAHPGCVSPTAEPSSAVVVVGVCAHEVRIPRISTDVEVVVAEFLPGRLPEDVSCDGVKRSIVSQGVPRSISSL